MSDEVQRLLNCRIKCRDIGKKTAGEVDPLAYYPFTEAARHGSGFGCAMALVIVAVWLGMSGIFLSRLIQNDVNVSDTVQGWDPAATYPMPKLGASFGVNSAPYLNETVFYFLFEQNVYLNQGKTSITKTSLRAQRCMVGPKGFEVQGYCPQDSGVIRGLFNDPVYAFVKISLLPCNSKARNDCVPLGVSNDIFFNDKNDRSLDIFYNTDLDEHTTLTASVFSTFSAPANIGRKMEVYFQPRTIIHRPQFFYGATTVDLMQFHRADPRTEPYRGGSYFSAYVRVSEIRVLEVQTPQLILDFLKSVGGIFTLLMLTCGTVGRVYNKFMFHRHLAHYDPATGETYAHAHGEAPSDGNLVSMSDPNLPAAATIVTDSAPLSSTPSPTASTGRPKLKIRSDTVRLLLSMKHDTSNKSAAVLSQQPSKIYGELLSTSKSTDGIAPEKSPRALPGEKSPRALTGEKNPLFGSGEKSPRSPLFGADSKGLFGEREKSSLGLVSERTSPRAQGAVLEGEKRSDTSRETPREQGLPSPTSARPTVEVPLEILDDSPPPPRAKLVFSNSVGRLGGTRISPAPSSPFSATATSGAPTAW